MTDSCNVSIYKDILENVILLMDLILNSIHDNPESNHTINPDNVLVTDGCILRKLSSTSCISQRKMSIKLQKNCNKDIWCRIKKP